MVLAGLLLLVIVLQFVNKREQFGLIGDLKSIMPGLVTATNFDKSSNQVSYSMSGLTTCSPGRCQLLVGFLVTYSDGSINSSVLDIYAFPETAQGSFVITSNQQTMLENATTKSGKTGKVNVLITAGTNGTPFYQTNVDWNGYSYTF